MDKHQFARRKPPTSSRCVELLLGGPRPGAEKLRSPAHEMTHQLTYNTGLLDPLPHVPAGVVEGLAMLGCAGRRGVALPFRSNRPAALER